MQRRHFLQLAAGSAAALAAHPVFAATAHPPRETNPTESGRETLAE